MAYVSLSRVRSLSGLRFQRNCPTSLECAGCARCTCRLTPSDIRASPSVRLYYRLAADLAVASDALCAALLAHGAEREDLAVAAAEVSASGPRSLAAASRALSERIDVPLGLRKKAHETFVAAQALNPGEVGATCGGWAHHAPGTCIRGWWSIAPQCDSKASRR